MHELNIQDDMNDFLQPLYSIIEQTVRSMQSLRGLVAVTIDELAIEISPMVAATVFAPLFSRQPGTVQLHLMTIINHVLIYRFSPDEIEVTNGKVYFFPRYNSDSDSDEIIANYQREFLAQLMLGEAKALEELRPEADILIGKVHCCQGLKLDPLFVAHLIKTGVDLNFMSLNDIKAIEPDEGR
jgi:hypothetical protein